MDAKQFVVEQMSQTTLPLKAIAASAGVGESWLRMFARGRIPDPSYSRIKALSDYFMRTGEASKPAASQASNGAS